MKSMGQSPERPSATGTDLVNGNDSTRRSYVPAHQLVQDLLYGLRQMGNSPGFAVTAILTVALGIGATTAIYSIADATLLHPLPYPQPEELVRVQADLPGVAARDVGLSLLEVRDLQNSSIFQYVAMAGTGSVNLTGASQPARIQFRSVTPNYLTTIGVKPILGRLFNPQDPTPGFNLEVVITEGLWKRVFGGTPNILGMTVRLDNDAYHVVGVLPASFRDQGRTSDQRNTELWCAYGFEDSPGLPLLRHTRLGADVIGRLLPGLSVKAAQSRLDTLVASLQRQYPSDYPPQSKWILRMEPLSESIVGDVRRPLILLLIAAGLVLSIGCVNVANLQLVRASGRTREIAVRQALGAPRSRLIRQLLTESILLSLLGGITGVVIMCGLKPALLRIVPESFPRINDVSIGWSVLLFALGITVIAGVIFGVAPALQTGMTDFSRLLRQVGRSSTGSRSQNRARSVLVVSEFALSLVLLIAAGLLLRSFWNLFQAPLGFDPENVMSIRSWLPQPNDPTTDIYLTSAQESPFLREILRRLKLLPGVEEAAIGNPLSLPFNHLHSTYPLILEGRKVTGSDLPRVLGANVSPEYFHLVGIPLLRGRLFSAADNEISPEVAVINDAMARTWWPDGKALGKRLSVNPGSSSWITVVGVVPDARTESLENANIPKVYLCSLQRASRNLVFYVRGRFDPGRISEQVREQVQSVNPELPVFQAKMLHEVVSEELSQRRLTMEIISLFALTALLLAGFGIYGTISYVVSESTRQIGVRIALGAQRKNIMKMVLGKGTKLAIAGAFVGLVGAAIVSHLMTGLLYGVSPTDPLAFLGPTILLTLVALAACYLPARKAMRVDPAIALRYD